MSGRRQSASEMIGVSGVAVRRSGRSRRSSMTETRSAALPACSDGFDDIDGGPERGVYIQMSGIEQVRIGRALQRGCTAGHVTLVAAQNIGKHIGKRRRLTDLAELAGATARA